MNRSFPVICMTCAALLVPALASAQGYPSRTVRILIGTPAGGPGDVASRGVAQAFSQALGQPFVVENRVGADGMIAGEACARATPDGYTLLTADNYVTVVNSVARLKMPYDPFRDLAPIGLYGYLGAAILVHPSVPANTWKELVAMAKAKPNTVTWGAYGISSASHMYIEYLRKVQGISFYNVPYKAASLAFPAMLAGEVQVAFFAVGPAAQSVKAGKAKALLVVNDKRTSHLPDVPTYKEAGLDLSIVTLFGLFGPSGLPREIVQRLNTEMARGLINNAVAKEKFLTSQGIEPDAPAGGSPEAFAALLVAEREKFAKVVKAANIVITD